MYALPNSRIQIYDFVNTGIRFCQYQYTISLIPVYDFVNTGNIFKDLGRFEVEIEDSKNMGGLRNIPGHRIQNKTEVKNFYTSDPLTFGNKPPKSCFSPSNTNHLSPAATDPTFLPPVLQPPLVYQILLLLLRLTLILSFFARVKIPQTCTYNLQLL